jgi:hypothetical protein
LNEDRLTQAQQAAARCLLTLRNIGKVLRHAILHGYTGVEQVCLDFLEDAEEESRLLRCVAIAGCHFKAIGSKRPSMIDRQKGLAGDLRVDNVVDKGPAGFSCNALVVHSLIDCTPNSWYGPSGLISLSTATLQAYNDEALEARQQTSVMH